MIDPHDKSDWRQVMLAQYSIFGTIAGLEVASLAILGGLSDFSFTLIQKILFTLTSVILLLEIPFILWLINQERKVAFNEPDMTGFKKSEKNYRNTLIFLMILGWVTILLLLLSVVWFN